MIADHVEAVSIVIICKDDPALATTLDSLSAELENGHEIIVVDASAGRLDDIRRRHPRVRWAAFDPPSGVRVSIPHQRNVGVRHARHDVVVFVDAGCVPQENWLRELVGPIWTDGENISCGSAYSPRRDIYGGVAQRGTRRYLDECPTINLAFRRTVFDKIGGFDESFEYGSDVDFSWRLIDAGFAIRNQYSAVVEHDWGSSSRQLRRAQVYGKARARLYAKHHHRWRAILRRDPVAVVYPLYLLGLPLAKRHPWYLVLLMAPLWRARRNHPVATVADHLVYGAGILQGFWTLAREKR